ncbi:histidine acid phosphatase [Apodospora peruviana]|uniref:Histidine acid phosphatase n=1 Tax=Apodospora peruviana TaxID=516989 RepID=A0AAE0HY15_9PEZI|nr:histidine acid phosphatase [Apodospora peruviana]
MWSSSSSGGWHLLATFAGVSSYGAGAGGGVDIGWYAPASTKLNNITAVVDGTGGVYDFIYNSSDTTRYGTYNWCNMPHVRKTEYVKAAKEYELVYVELIHRHHKRTPYASNAFPVEPYHWNCDDQGLYFYGKPIDSKRKTPAAQTYWKGYLSAINPFVPSGWIGTCQFPQITTAGLDDSWQHGADLHDVYHDLLNFLPSRDSEKWRDRVVYRVTNNLITSQVAGMVINGMWNASREVPLLVQASTIDSLEPKYPCAKASFLFDKIKSNERWKEHLNAAKPLYSLLDNISGVPVTDNGFHEGLDHYYDNLSARQCHQKPFPCKIVDGKNDTSECITQDMANKAYRFGHWEYSHIYRDAGEMALTASVASFGVWIAELAEHLREVMTEKQHVLWYHNIAHDGSVSRLLSVLQVDEMVWPGMGAEVVFEQFYKKKQTSGGGGDGGYFVRVLFGGRVLTSSNPSLGVMDMIPVETLLGYFDGLVGRGASLVAGKCGN